MLREKKKIQPRILYLVKLSFKGKGELETFSDKKKKKLKKSVRKIHLARNGKIISLKRGK